MQEIVLGNAIWNALWNTGLLAVAAFFIRKWMSNIEDSNKLVHAEAKAAADLASKVALASKDEAANTCVKIDESLERIYEQLKIANGRTAKLETAVEVQKVKCEERAKHISCKPS